MREPYSPQDLMVVALRAKAIYTSLKDVSGDMVGEKLPFLHIHEKKLLESLDTIENWLSDLPGDFAKQLKAHRAGRKAHRGKSAEKT